MRHAMLRFVAFLALTCLVLALGACSREKETVRIATKPMTEQFILGEMLSQLIETHTGLKVELVKGVGGGTGNIHPALCAGEFDAYPEYTGTGWAYVLKKDGQPEPEVMLSELRSAYAPMGLAWTAVYGFNNTYALAVREEFAREHDVETFSDLASLAPELVFGAEYDFFERDDGYNALSRAYGFAFKRTVDMDIGLKYQALESGKADVMVVFTTDGKLVSSPVRVLKDDKSFFPSYHCATVVRTATLERHPELVSLLARMEQILDDEGMAVLNAAVEEQGQNERDVARVFLQTRGLIP